jgi:hypothetical protein
MSFRLFFLSLVLLYIILPGGDQLISPHILFQFGHPVWNLSYVGVFPFM